MLFAEPARSRAGAVGATGAAPAMAADLLAGFPRTLAWRDRLRAIGHGRVLAARKLGLAEIPVMIATGWSEAQKRAYVLADNKLALNAGWDEELLSFELKDLVSLDKDFEMGIMGFSTSEIDGLLEGVSLEEPGDPKDDRLPEMSDVAVSNPGDLWLLGPHRLLCGSALSAEDCARLMAGSMAQMVITDPPYNVPIAGHVSGLGKTRHREFAAASGEMSPAEFTAFLETSFRNLAGSSTDGSIHMIFMDWRHMAEVQQAGSRVYAELKNLIVWVKDNGGMGSFYRSRHELIFVFKVGTAPHINSFELGQHGRYRTNVWDYAGISSISASRQEELEMHPTVKPVALIADAIRDCSKRGQIVLDGFGGSGSTLIAAEKCGRVARLIELDPGYCDVIVARWQKLTGKRATLSASGEAFEDVASDRLGQLPGEQAA